MHSIVDLEAVEPAADTSAPQRLSLSVCAMTRGESVSLAPVLELLRPLATEVIVALDERAEDESARLAAVADEVVLFPHRKPGEIGVHSLRLGDEVGKHSVFFAALGERLELTHNATNRDTFVHGALRAAKWLANQRAGRYTVANVLGI